MIIWLASYPKSGNTFLRSLLSAYFFTKDGNFQLESLDKITQFPNINIFKKFGVDTKYQGFRWSEEDETFIATGGDPRFRINSLDVKNVFVHIFKSMESVPEKSEKRETYYDKEKIEKFFDLEHEYFINKDLPLSEQMSLIDEPFEKQIQDVLRNKVTFNIIFLNIIMVNII